MDGSEVSVLKRHKLEILLVGFKAYHEKINIPYMNIDDEEIPPSLDAQNIEFIFDRTVKSMSISPVNQSGISFNVKKH